MAQNVNSNVNKKQRCANWSSEEEMCLVDTMVEDYEFLFGPFSNKITNVEKSIKWAKITEKINAVGGNNRKLASVQMKWTDMKSRTKVRASNILREQKKTGGGLADFVSFDEVEEKLSGLLKQWEMKVTKLIGLVGILGIPGGIDTSAPISNALKSYSSPSSSNVNYLEAPKETLEALKYEKLNDSDSPCQNKTDEEDFCYDNQPPRDDISSVKNEKNEAPKTFKKGKNRELGTEISTEMLSVHKEIRDNTNRIADSMEKMVTLMENYISAKEAGAGNFLVSYDQINSSI